MKRLDGWQRRFVAVTDEIRRKPFAWGSHDCGPAFAGRIVEALTGDDIAAPFRGKYDDAAGALRTLRETGFTDLADLVASLLPEIHPSRARKGDLAAFKDDSPFGASLGIVNGERVLVLRPEGIGTMDLLAAHRAYRVG